MAKPNALIVDMDGTLANVSSIRHHLTTYDATKRRVIKHFDRFHEESVNVPPHPEVVDQVWRAHLLGTQIIIVTARRHQWRNHTAWWLALHGVPSDAMFMRGNEDHRSDVEVKKDILEIIRKAWTPIHAIDDNPAIIALWISEGISVTQILGYY